MIARIYVVNIIYIGERARNVLVEHFTNTNDVNHITASNYIEQVKNIKSNIGVIDMISLEYHIAIGGDDQYNKDNNEDPSARTIIYGVQQPIQAIADGSVFNNNTFLLDDVVIDKRSLIDPGFDIQISEVSAINSRIDLSINITATRDFANPVIVHTAIIEKRIITNSNDTLRNVLKKLLPTAAGSTELGPWLNGENRNFTRSWNIDMTIYDSTQLAVIVFVQNKDVPLEIYQAEIADISTKISSPPVGIEDILLSEIKDGYSII